jgi:hypothetical protein
VGESENDCAERKKPDLRRNKKGPSEVAYICLTNYSEPKNRRIALQGQPRQKVSETLSQHINQAR